MSIDWPTELVAQLDFHWTTHVRPRLDGLTDAEYLWEPAPGCWSLRPRDAPWTSGMAAGGGDLVIDFDFPAPDPPPLTTIAWRLAHVTVGVLGMRNAAHFGGPPVDYQTAVWAPDAATALAQLDEAYAGWSAGVSALDEAGLARPIGDAEPFPTAPMAALVLHINREAIHHLAEVLLLRDLYRVSVRTGPARP